MSDVAADGNNDHTETTIYTGNDSENEEILPAIDLENEEASEDELEFYMNDEESEHNRIMMEFDENDENNGSDNEYGSESESDEPDEEVIIDKPFSNEQMPQTFGEFAPYFKNITESLFFCWMEKHHICK